MNTTQKPPGVRTLDNDVPELKPFLKPGLKVLDVGCGTGTITLGIADAVKPGEVVGIDRDERVDVAINWATQVAHPGNITYQVGDSYRLEFPDATFDLVFSHTVQHFFLEPILALKEQKRVTKQGGWVIASGVRDAHAGVTFRYPSCPHWDKVYNAYHRYFVARLEEYHASGKDPIAFAQEYETGGILYIDWHAGRKCAEWFHQAGLVDVQIAMQPLRVAFQGHKDMKPRPLDLLIWDESASLGEYHSAQDHFSFDHQRMIAMGLLDEATLERAKQEARAWYKDPGAFEFWPEIFAAGRVP
jgi:ubiquinone/menaquinone biosynthesis C-methylase UbiE